MMLPSHWSTRTLWIPSILACLISFQFGLCCYQSRGCKVRSSSCYLHWDNATVFTAVQWKPGYRTGIQTLFKLGFVAVILLPLSWVTNNKFPSFPSTLTGELPLNCHNDRHKESSAVHLKPPQAVESHHYFKRERRYWMPWHTGFGPAKMEKKKMCPRLLDYLVVVGAR